ncbi:N-acetyltransferase [Paenibacillus nanensis]|uniref:N-acetyltransferase n=2 Tax=Paenibacillus nanensis TaxID=393251 RepID=A0A3A1UIR7_9BACL|nr:N-acetyltransferase [Paenibacillus nanensis]
MLWGETVRLYLYVPDMERDLDAHAEMMKDEGVGRWLPKGAGYTREETERFIRYFMKHWQEFGYGAWAVYSKQTGQFLGHCGLNVVQDMGVTEVLYAFSKEARGKGYCTEAASAALDWAFGDLGLDTVIGLAKQGNEPSTAVMKRLGMTYQSSFEWRGMHAVRYEINRTTYTQK